MEFFHFSDGTPIFFFGGGGGGGAEGNGVWLEKIKVCSDIVQ